MLVKNSTPTFTQTRTPNKAQTDLKLSKTKQKIEKALHPTVAVLKKIIHPNHRNSLARLSHMTDQRSSGINDEWDAM